MNWKYFETIHRVLKNVRSRNLLSGTEENHEENSVIVARMSAIIRIGCVPGTDVEHYLLGDQF